MRSGLRRLSSRKGRPTPSRRRALWLLVPALILAAGMAVALGAPRAAAFACPSCYGFSRIAPGIHAEPGAGDLLPVLREAQDRVAAFYGGFARHPEILICRTPDCHARMRGDGARAMTYGTHAIYVSPRGLEATFLAHELAHIEAHARIGLVGLVTGRVPAWFDEGLAVIISRDPRHVNSQGRVVGCAGAADPSTLPRNARTWRRQAGKGQGRSQYHDAACAVQTWLDAHGKAALDAIFERGLPPVSSLAPPSH